MIFKTKDKNDDVIQLVGHLIRFNSIRWPETSDCVCWGDKTMRPVWLAASKRQRRGAAGYIYPVICWLINAGVSVAYLSQIRD